MTISTTDWIIIALIACVLIVLIIGYAVKKRIPSAKKFNPHIAYGGEFLECKIKVKKMTRIIPFVAEKAIVFCNKPTMACNVPNMHIVSAGKNRFKILNEEKYTTGDISVCGEKYTEAEREALANRTFDYRNFSINRIPAPGNRAGQFYFGMRK